MSDDGCFLRGRLVGHADGCYSKWADERDALAAAERYRIAIRKACAIFLKHNAFCECQGCTDIVLRLAPSHTRAPHEQRNEDPR